LIKEASWGGPKHNIVEFGGEEFAHVICFLCDHQFYPNDSFQTVLLHYTCMHTNYVFKHFPKMQIEIQTVTKKKTQCLTKLFDVVYCQELSDFPDSQDIKLKLLASKRELSQRSEMTLD
jgi:hypothetical protein